MDRPSSSSRPAQVLAALAVCFVFLVTAGTVATLVWRAAQPRGKHEANPLAARGVKAEVPPPPSGSGAPITDDECRQLAAAIAAAVADGNAAGYEALIDWDGIIRRATAGTGAAEELRNEYAAGVRNRLRQNSLAAQIIEAVRPTGSYQLLRIRQERSQKRLLFRMVLPESGGVNYHELYLARGADSSVAIADIYVFLTGELMSTTLRRSFLPLAAQQSRGVFERLTGTEQEILRHSQTISQMTEAVRGGRPEETLRLYRTLPASIQHDKNLLIVRLQASQLAGDDDEYMQVLEAFRRHHAGDAAAEFLAIDYHVLRDQHDDAIACLDRLDEQVGGDPHLDLVRVGLLADAGRLPQAREAAERAVDEDPLYEETYFTLGGLLLDEGKFKEFLALSDRFEENFDAPLDAVPGHARGKEFRQSPEYREWLARREAASP